MSKRSQGNELGLRIKRARERRNWTQVQLAEAVGVKAKSVSNWETGATTPLNRLGKLEEVLGPQVNPDNDVRVTEGSSSSEDVSVMFAHYGDLSPMELLRLSRIISDEAVRRSDR